MNRREFLKIACAAGSFSLFPAAKVWALGGATDLRAQKLVVVFLRGAADGLSMVVPYGDHNYYSARAPIAIAPPGTKDGAIDLDGHFGLHPSLEPVKKYWQNKTLAFFYACGSPDPTRSHFEAQQYMESGALGGSGETTGWLNRLVQVLPPRQSLLQALSVAARPARIVAGPAPVAHIEELDNQVRPLNTNLEPFEKLYAASGGEAGKIFIDGVTARKQLQDRLSTFMREKTEREKKTDQKTDISFGQQLAYLLKNEPGMQVAFIDLGFDFWDTHTQQNNLMYYYNSVLAKGLSDLVEGLGSAYADTTVVVISEFGRTVKDNGNGGTDHGHGNVMWVLGGGVPGGKVYGRFDTLATKELHEERDLPVTTDFRQILGYLLNERMAVAKVDLAKIFPDFSLYTNPFIA